MSRIGVPEPALNKYLDNVPAVLKKNLRLPDARKYADAISSAGGIVNIQEMEKISERKISVDKIKKAYRQDFTICTNCGFKQKNGDFCIRCGFKIEPGP